MFAVYMYNSYYSTNVLLHGTQRNEYLFHLYVLCVLSEIFI